MQRLPDPETYVVTTCVSQAVANEVGKHAEVIHKTYGRIFPKIGKEKRKYPIIVYKDRAEYHANGGPRNAAGHYSPFLRKLYLYRTEAKLGTGDVIDRDATLVLYHEGFHQYLHDYLEDAPQWFNEGLGDFFGASKYIPPKFDSMSGASDKGAIMLRPHPWRLKAIQSAIQTGQSVHWADLMLMSREEMYGSDQVGIYYAEAWSIVYFLVRAGAAPGKEAGPHFGILQDYFKALRRGAGLDEAFVAAFGNNSAALDKLMEEWAKFTVELDPGPN